MTQEEKDALVEKMADSIGDVWDCEEEDDERLRVYARAALSIAEPIIRKKALEEAANSLNDMKQPACSGAFDVHSARAWNGVLDYAQDHIRELSETK